jgi:hypothetical protein
MQDVGAVRGAGDEEPVTKEVFGMKPGFGDRFGGDDRVELSFDEFAGQRVGNRLAHLQVQFRKARLKMRDQLRQQVRRDGRDHADAKISHQQAAILRDHFLQRLDVAEDAADMRQEPLAGLREHHLAMAAFNQLALQPCLHIHDLGRQRGLRNIDRRRRFSEV